MAGNCISNSTESGPYLQYDALNGGRRGQPGGRRGQVLWGLSHIVDVLQNLTSRAIGLRPQIRIVTAVSPLSVRYLRVELAGWFVPVVKQSIMDRAL